MRFLNTEIDNLTFEEALGRIDALLCAKTGGYVVTPNVDHIIQLEKNAKLRAAYRDASLVLTDGQPLIWISRWLGCPIREKISGSDLFPRLCDLAARKQYTMYFLGAAEGVAAIAARKLRQSYPDLKVVGTHSPEYGFEKDPQKTEEVLRKIEAASPDILIAALGTPKQELFMWEHRERLRGILSFGLGASLDFAAGKVSRAPRWMQKCGLEWFYRLCREPRRLFKRYLIDDMKIFGLVWKYRNAAEDRTVIDLTALSDNFSGIERYAMNMALEFLRQSSDRMRFDLIFKGEIFPAFRPWEGHPMVRMHVLPACGKLLFNQWRLPRYLNRLKAERYFFFAFPMPVLLRCGRVFGTIHDMGCWDCPETMKRQMVWYFRLSYRRMAKKAERIITISKFSRQRIHEILHVPWEKIVVAYCGLSENFAAQPKSLEKESASRESVRPGEADEEIRRKYHLPASYYLCLSTLEPRKNMMLLLEAYLELLRGGQIRTPLVLAGRRGWKIEHLLAAADAEKSGQVVVTGFIDDGDLPTVYRLARCFVFPSIYEGFGIPPLEAMSQGVPVLSSDAASMPEILGDAAFYFKSGDPEDLKRALIRLEQCGADSLQEKTGNGRRRAARFGYAAGAERLLRLSR